MTQKTAKIKSIMIKKRLFTDNCDNCGSVPIYADNATFVINTVDRITAQTKILEIIEIMTRQKRVRMSGSPPQLTVLKPDGVLKIITASESIRLLGANIQRDLSWKSHLEEGEKAILPALRSTIGALKFISKNIPTKSRLLLAS